MFTGKSKESREEKKPLEGEKKIKKLVFKFQKLGERKNRFRGSKKNKKEKIIGTGTV